MGNGMIHLVKIFPVIINSTCVKQNLCLQAKKAITRGGRVNNFSGTRINMEDIENGDQKISKNELKRRLKAEQKAKEKAEKQAAAALVAQPSSNGIKKKENGAVEDEEILDPNQYYEIRQQSVAHW